MKNQYLIIRMTADDLHTNQFLMRGFNPKRIEQVIGVIVVVGNILKCDVYHLRRVIVDVLPSDTQQCLAKLTWSDTYREAIADCFNRLPRELVDSIRAMRNSRLYLEIDTTIPEAFRDCHTKFDIPSAIEVRERMNKRLRAEDARLANKTLADIPVEDIIAHLRTRLKGVTIIL